MYKVDNFAAPAEKAENEPLTEQAKIQIENRSRMAPPTVLQSARNYFTGLKSQSKMSSRVKGI